MQFSSIPFLYYLIPILLLAYWLTKESYKKYVLIGFSCLFCFYGDGIRIGLLIVLGFINYLLALSFGKTKHKKLLMLVGVVCDLAVLAYFKYTNFFIGNINSLLNTNIYIKQLVLPLGISYYTFRNISYLVDVYKEKYQVEKKLSNYMNYILFFPMIISGPISRYGDFNYQKTDYDSFATGVSRFIIGLSKKVILANNLASLNSLVNSQKSVLGYWIIAFSYALQLYLDFSGYSDMALGLAQMLGYKLKENFNYPYIATSITDFWRRWHISLSMFFRDYIYIPLGGNRKGKGQQIINIMIVWLLTGLWHGASWNFVLWGVYFGVILLLEKFLWPNIGKIKVLNHIYTILVVVLGFVIFNASNMTEVIESFKGLFAIAEIPFSNEISIYYLKSNIVLILASIICCLPVTKWMNKVINKDNKVWAILEVLILFVLLICATAYMIDASFNPFLYFRF